MMSAYLVLSAIGLAAGLLGGLLGVGGSILMIPAMHLILGPAQHVYQGAAMIVNFFVAFPAVIQHRRASMILGPVVRVTIPTAALGVVAGVWFSDGYWFHGDNEIYLSRVFGAFLLYVAGYNAYRLCSTDHLPDITADAALQIPVWRTALLIGTPTGLVAGLLGIGGGALAVPLQQVFLRMPLRRAIANSATTILLLSVIGSVYKNVANARAGLDVLYSMGLAAILIPTAMIGGFIGGRLTHTLPRPVLRVAVVLLMLYGGISLLRGR